MERLRAHGDTYCSAVLCNGAFAVQDVIDPTSDPRLTSLGVNQGTALCRHRGGDVQLSQLLTLQSSTQKCTSQNGSLSHFSDNLVSSVLSVLVYNAVIQDWNSAYLCRFSGVFTCSLYNVGCSSKVPLDVNHSKALNQCHLYHVSMQNVL